MTGPGPLLTMDTRGPDGLAMKGRRRWRHCGQNEIPG
jgi:hypothetical protein